jgi:Zn-dependent peptidase ImmA (M78 family)
MMNLIEIKNQAAAQAAALLIECGINGVPVNVQAIANHKGVKVVVQALDEGTSGVIVIKNNHAVIGVNQDHHPNRQRFSIAHELGHYLPHRTESNIFIDTTYTFYRDDNSTSGIDEREIAANTFAAELLMPHSLLKSYVDDNQVDVHDEVAIRRLARRFSVSEQALTIRLINLGLIVS